MSPILVRPVREQLEQDRVIRLLQAKYKRKSEVGINPGSEQAVPIGSGASAIFPDLVLQSSERNRKVLGVIEVETSESINHLEAMSQWASLARLRVPFYLYVPAISIDTTRRLCADYQIPFTEIWTYHSVGDQMRFTIIARGQHPPQSKGRSRAAVRPSRRAATASSARKSAAKPRARGTRTAAKASARGRSTRKKPSRSGRAQKRK